MAVRLRTEKLSKGRKSVYLDVYIDATDHYQKRLGIYLIPEKSQADKQKNKDAWKLAELIRNEHESDILNKRYGKEDPRKQYNNSFLEYFNRTVELRFETGVNYDTWVSVYKHLVNFTGGKLTFDQINENLLEEFKSYFLKKVSQNSAHAYFNKVKRAIHAAFRDKLIDHNPAFNVQSPKMVNTHREYLTEEELLRLKDLECKYPVLKRAFFFSVLTGLRWSDIQNLKWKNVQEIEDVNYLVFTTRKTKDAERLPINKEARKILGEENDGEERVFIGLKYSAWHNIAICQWMIQADIKKHITFHCARHTHATLLLNKGVDIFTVSKMLGHKELKTTQIYAKLANQTKVDATEKLPSIF